jgi:hypothetical protein
VLRLLAAGLTAAGEYYLREAFLLKAGAGAHMLEAAVRAAYSKPIETFTGAAGPAVHTPESREDLILSTSAGCKVLLDRIVDVWVLAALEDDDGALDIPLLFVQLEQAETRSMLHAVQQAVRPGSSGVCSVAVVVAAAEAAAEAGAAAAQQERLQLLLRVVSLLGSCVKVMARDQQQQHSVLGWGRVATLCGAISELCQQIADVQGALDTARWAAMREDGFGLEATSDEWCLQESQQAVSAACKAAASALLQHHLYARQLLSAADVDCLHALFAQGSSSSGSSSNGPSAPGAPGGDTTSAAAAAAAWAAAALAAEPSAPPEHVLLAALLRGPLSDGRSSHEAASCADESSSASSPHEPAQDGSATTSTQRVSSSEQPTSLNVPSSSSSRQLTVCDVKLACIAVAVRAMRVYAAVLDAALGHPCLSDFASTQERRVAAAQLMQQLQQLCAAGEVVVLPDSVQQQLQGGGPEAYLALLHSMESADVAAAVIGGLLGNVEVHYVQAVHCAVWLGSQLSSWLQPANDELRQVRYSAGPADRQELEALLKHTYSAEEALQGAAPMSWLQAPRPLRHHTAQWKDSGAQCHLRLTCKLYGSVSSVRGETPGATAERRAAWVRASLPWLDGYDDDGPLDLGLKLRSWADAVAAALPSRSCCSNPCCVSLREMSEWQMVGGRGCVCGGCAAGSGQAVRYCSRECQTAHWPAHKPVCLRLRQQQQLQSPAAEQQT